MRILLSLTILLFLFATVGVHAQQVEFNYEGRVLSSGIPFTGPGYFKFAIVDKAGTLTLWSNDGTSTAGDEPAAAIVSDVTDGVFNVIVGDVSGYGMEPLDASLFNVDERVKLRVWFSDSVVVDSFEQLNPDRVITNPGLLGSQSYNEITLFVDPVSGDDKYPGNYNHPKQTIQAAWNALPSSIKKNATIYLRDGVYREKVLLTGKTVVGDATIAISGNIASPTAVRITGANEGAETTPVLERAFRIEYQSRVLIQGVSIDYYTEKGIDIEMNGFAEIQDCVIQNCMYGIGARRGKVIARRVQIQDDYAGIYTPCGIRVDGAGYGQLYNCSISNFNLGIVAGSQGQIEITECSIDSAVTGVSSAGLSYVAFKNPNSIKTTISNCSTQGAACSLNAVLTGANINVTYSNCPLNVAPASRGGQIYN